ncbi:LUD domain-containing protein, partial [Helicobacter sp.]|nr:LUD domain-containing protein [Helicobacter sp.]
VENLYAGIECIKTYEKNRSGSEILPTNIIFVAGPSRTADIELQTVFGVHGPRVVYVVLY